jgi:ferredoxin
MDSTMDTQLSIKSKITSLYRFVQLAKLARIMNKQNDIPLPITKPLLDCLDLVVSKSECELLIKIGGALFAYEYAHQVSGLEPDNFNMVFSNLLKKGIIWEKDGEKGQPRYIIAPILVGWFELQLSDGGETALQKEFSKRLSKLFNSWKRFNKLPARGVINKILKYRFKPFQSVVPASALKKNREVIHVGKNITVPDSEILTSTSAIDLVSESGKYQTIALMHCFCRQWHKLADDKCDFNFPEESCIVIGDDMAEYTIKYGFGRRISLQEALDVIEKCSKEGAIHTVFHERDNTDCERVAICNCCKDCCGVYGSYNKGLIPLYFKCYYLSEIANSDCLGCRLCQKYCPTCALSVENKSVVLDSMKCIGCGQCVLQCKNQNFILIQQERNVLLPLKMESSE